MTEIERLAELVNADAKLVHRGRFIADMRVLLEVGEEHWLIRIRDGRVAEMPKGPLMMPSWDFALRASREDWERFWEPIPAPGYNDLFALMRFKRLRVEGDMYPFMSNLFYFKGMMETLREASMSEPVFEPVVGRYMRLDLLGKPHRVYVEEAGQGIPLLCLHTAGADGRQFRGIINDPEILSRFRVIVFDMPRHGKSSPPAGWHEEIEYRLTAQDYLDIIIGVADALKLDKPVAMGCSIGGRVILHLALKHPDRFRALIGLQASASVSSDRDTSWVHRPDIHSEICAATVSGLIGPTATAENKWETLWHYMQGGPGIFKGDVYFQRVDGDMRDRLHEIDPKRCPLYLLTGEYDYSCTPDATRETAAKIGGGIEVTEMKGLGHFPMSENPEGLLRYLRPVLARIV